MIFSCFLAISSWSVARVPGDILPCCTADLGARTKAVILLKRHGSMQVQVGLLNSIHCRSQQGAALLLILLILGLFGATALMTGVKSSTRKNSRQIATQIALTQSREALLGFAVRNGRLPRPAVSATDGRESSIPCRDDSSCTGVLPWMALGLPALDGSGLRLRYSVAPDFTSSPIDFSKAVATKTVQVRLLGGLQYIAGQAICERSAQCVPALIWSSGERNFGITPNGDIYASVVDQNVDERANATAVLTLIQRPVADRALETVGGEFDDQLIWVPLLPLINRITSSIPGPS